MSMLNASRDLRQAIERVVKDVVTEQTRSCFRVYPAIVDTAPNSSTGICGVHLVGDTVQLSLPYSTAVQSVTAGDMVLVATVSDSWRNAVVWQTYSFK